MNMVLSAAKGIHVVRGTRSLGVALAVSLLFVALEPSLGAPARVALSLLIVAFVAIGLATLPREGVAVQDRLIALVGREDGVRTLLRHAVLPVLLVVLLWPSVFLAAYGVPHLSPLTGLILPSLQARFAVVYLYLLMWLPLWAVRRTRRFDADIKATRPGDLSDDDPRHTRREILIVLTLLVAVVWLFVLRPYWAPFSLFEWPPGIGSLVEGAGGAARLMTVLVFPVTLFVRTVAYAQALGHLVSSGQWRTRAPMTGTVALHVLLAVLAAGLHMYNLLWVARYQAGVSF